MLMLAFALNYLAMLLLCLTMSRHRGALMHVEIPSTGLAAMRVLALLGMGGSIACCVASGGWEIGAVLWLCLLMLSGVLLALVLAWRSGWALPLAPLLLLGGTLQGVL